MSEREELLSNAVKFLKDPKVQSSPLTKKISFLESKGLTASEIEEALTLSKTDSQPAEYPGSTAPQPPANYINPNLRVIPPPENQTTWKDYVIAAVSVTSLTVGTYTLIKHYVLPHISWPTASALEEDTKKITSSLSVTTSALESVEKETVTLHKLVEEQSLQVSDEIGKLVAVLEELKVQESLRDKELVQIKQEVDEIKEMIPKLIDKSKEHQNSILTDLQSELKSLKTLMLNRRTYSEEQPSGIPQLSHDTVASPQTSLLPSFNKSIGKPSIPAWQLESKSPSNA
ncbi:peroxisomal membrane protein pex14 [Nowakowskiella sp. JEL0407]|nr:peroxisomal membrane protein pex14 [Nowakowskiella sp. JEL0407]